MIMKYYVILLIFLIMRYNLQIVLLLLSFGYAQPKLNIQLGSGFYSPNLIGMDSDSNSTIPKSLKLNSARLRPS